MMPVPLGELANFQTIESIELQREFRDSAISSAKSRSNPSHRGSFFGPQFRLDQLHTHLSILQGQHNVDEAACCWSSLRLYTDTTAIPTIHWCFLILGALTWTAPLSSSSFKTTASNTYSPSLWTCTVPRSARWCR